MIRVGLIGCGKIAYKHLTALNNNKSKFKLVSACDTNFSKCLKFSKKNNINAYSSAAIMLEKEKIDLLVLLTPHGNHLRDYEKLTKYKKHFIFEKPLALNAKDANKINAISKKIKKNIFVVNQNRFNLPVEYFMRVHRKKKLGNIFLGNASLRWRRDEKYFDQASWRGTRKLDGGVIGNQASHHLELLIHILGKVKEVSAMGSNFLVKKIESFDTVIANLKFNKNKFASIEATTATSPKDIEGLISFFGKKGTVILSGFSMNNLKYLSYKYKNKIIDDNFKSKKKVHNHSKFYEYVHKHFNNKKIINKNLETAIHVAKVIECINLSAEQNKLIKVK